MVKWIPGWVKLFMLLIGPISSYLIWLDRICRPFGEDHKRNLPFQIVLGIIIPLIIGGILGQVFEYVWLNQLCDYCYQCPECPK